MNLPPKNTEKSDKITGLYERLSKDDLSECDSVSIENQKAILEKYAADNGFVNTCHFSDDGVSGTLFRRPGLDALIDEVKVGNVSTVIVKDQSRIGRDVLEVGLLKRTLVYYRQLKGLPPLNKDTTWFNYTVIHMIENPAYIGNLMSQKTTTPSYKNHKSFVRPEEEWVTVENHHPAIIEKEVFDLAQKLRDGRRRKPSKRTGDCSPLSGILW